MPPFTTLVVEDSRLAREGLVRMLSRFTQLELVGQAGDLAQALQLAQSLRPALLFLDLHLPGGSGFELLEQLDYEPRVIFTTAHAEHAIRSFDHRTVDYLLKPIAAERLAQAVAKLTLPTLPDDDAAGDASELRTALEPQSRLFIQDEGHCHLVQVTDIRCVESSRNHVRVHFGAHKAYVKRSLNAVEARMPPGLFFRANRQMLINLRAVHAITPTLSEGFLVTLDDGQRVEVSRRNAIALKALLSL